MFNLFYGYSDTRLAVTLGSDEGSCIGLHSVGEFFAHLSEAWSGLLNHLQSVAFHRCGVGDSADADFLFGHRLFLRDVVP